MSTQHKGILIGILVTLVAVILYQNTQVVTLKFLFWRVSMSQILLIPIFVLTGMAIGYYIGKRSW